MKTLDECKAQHGTVWSLKSADGSVIVFRKPTYHEWRKFKAAVATAKVSEDGVHLIDAQEDLAKSCVVSHSPAELEVKAEDDLDLFSTISDEVSRVAAKKDTDLATKS